MSRPFWIFGSVPPEPNGGICVFVERLIKSRTMAIAGLVDPYPGRKTDLEVPHLFPAKAGASARFRILARLRALRRDPLFVNGSTTRAVLFLAPFLAGRTASTALILHHGDLGDPARMSPLRRALWRRLLSAYDGIGFLSDQQAAFYCDIGVEEHRLKAVDIYLPPAAPPTHGERPLVRDLRKWIAEGSAPLVVGCGPQRPSYHHDWPLDALGGSGPPFRYLLCTYGDETAEGERLRERFAGHRDARFVYGLDPAEFDGLLGLGDIFVRPFSLESFGIAVRDAAAKGLTIVASDACDRPPAFLHRTGDKKDFLAQLDRALATARARPARRPGAAPGRGMPIQAFLRDTLGAG